MPPTPGTRWRCGLFGVLAYDEPPTWYYPVRETLASHARLDFLRGLRVVPAELGGEAGLVGAAALLDT